MSDTTHQFVTFLDKEDMVEFRESSINGRDYVVFTATLLKEKVVKPANLSNGGAGFFVDMAEFKQDVARWNDIPVVLNHPNGQTARSQAILDDSFIGRIYNARFSAKDNALKADIYFDKDLCEGADDPRKEIYLAAKSGKKMELSIGFDSKIVRTDTPQEYNGDKYVGKFEGIKPDHLAALHNQKGACSVADGCGINNFVALSEKGEDVTLALYGSECGGGCIDEPKPYTSGNLVSILQEAIQIKDLINGLTGDDTGAKTTLSANQTNKEDDMADKNDEGTEVKANVLSQALVDMGLIAKAEDATAFFAGLKDVADGSKDTLVAKLSASKACKLSAEQLKEKSIVELNTLSQAFGLSDEAPSEPVAEPDAGGSDTDKPDAGAEGADTDKAVEDPEAKAKAEAEAKAKADADADAKAKAELELKTKGDGKTNFAAGGGTDKPVDKSDDNVTLQFGAGDPFLTEVQARANGGSPQA